VESSPIPSVEQLAPLSPHSSAKDVPCGKHVHFNDAKNARTATDHTTKSHDEDTLSPQSQKRHSAGPREVATANMPSIRAENSFTHTDERRQSFETPRKVGAPQHMTKPNAMAPRETAAEEEGTKRDTSQSPAKGGTFPSNAGGMALLMDEERRTHELTAKLEGHIDSFRTQVS